MFARSLNLACIALALTAIVAPCPGIADAAELRYEIAGVDERLATNVRQHLQAFRITRPSASQDGNRDRLLKYVVENTRAALRPYGYYAPDIDVAIDNTDRARPLAKIRIERGPPLIVEDAYVRVTGAGTMLGELAEWQLDWSLREGRQLNQRTWEEQKRRALDIANQHGYLNARYSEKRVELDLERHRAVLRLTLDTGPRYVFGDVTFSDHELKDGIVEYVARFGAGTPYSRRLLDRFRADLWKTGFFTSIDVRELRDNEPSPPVVSLQVDVETESRNHYQGAIGFGTDTGARLQAQYSRHPMSANGDRFDIGMGWQEQDDEYSVRGAYRLPRRHRVREYFTADLQIRNENLDLEVTRTPDDDSFVQLANGNVNEYHVRLGRLKVRNFKAGEQQALETLFVQALSGERELQPYADFPDLTRIAADPRRGRFLSAVDDTYSIGIDYDLVAVRGKGWNTRGHRERGWLFTSSQAFGSDVDFTQLYLSTRRSYVYGDKLKVLLRAELGYTDASVDEFSVDVNGEALDLSVTELPNYYRFKAGGSNSVRGYGFEELSNNLIGSNNLVSGSIEFESKVLPNWSVAAFADIGNAFNDWDKPELKTGVGVGVRWYSLAGPIRLDVAQALDLEGKPWRLHLSIGTPLL